MPHFVEGERGELSLGSELYMVDLKRHHSFFLKFMVRVVVVILSIDVGGLM